MSSFDSIVLEATIPSSAPCDRVPDHVFGIKYQKDGGLTVKQIQDKLKLWGVKAVIADGVRETLSKLKRDVAVAALKQIQAMYFDKEEGELTAPKSAKKKSEKSENKEEKKTEKTDKELFEADHHTMTCDKIRRILTKYWASLPEAEREKKQVALSGKLKAQLQGLVVEQLGWAQPNKPPKEEKKTAKGATISDWGRFLKEMELAPAAYFTMSKEEQASVKAEYAEWFANGRSIVKTEEKSD